MGLFPAFAIESLPNAHAMVLQTDACQYYETYQTTAKPARLPASPRLAARYRADAAVGTSRRGRLLDVLVHSDRPSRRSSRGVSGGRGYPRPRVRDGRDALRVEDGSSSPAAVANCTAGRAYKGPRREAANAMPAGAHIRLKASVDISGFNPEAKTVSGCAEAIRRLSLDTGSQNLIPFVNDVNGAPAWTSGDAHDLETLSIADFDVVNAPKKADLPGAALTDGTRADASRR